jgi:hypothetical protein
MKNLLTAVALTLTLTASAAVAAPVATTLSNYAYDFSSVGYEIELTAESYYHNPLNAGDYFRMIDGEYTMKTLFDGLSRKGRKSFEQFYNAQCEDVSYSSKGCRVTVSGEVELDSSMKMILTANEITVFGIKTNKRASFK